jgi:hypothetical protein
MPGSADAAYIATQGKGIGLVLSIFGFLFM